MLLNLPNFTPFFLAFRNISARRGRSSLTLLGIVLGVAVVLAIQVTNQTTLDSLSRVFDRATGKASLLVIPESEQGESLSEEMLPRLEKEAGVLVAAPSVRAQTLPANEATTWQIAFSMGGLAAGNMFALYGIDPQVDPGLRVYELQAGRMPKPEEYEVAIPAQYADEKSLSLGGNLVLLAPGGTASLKIVGLLADEGVALLNDGVVGFAPLTVVQDLFEQGSDLDEIALKVESSVSNDPHALAQLKDHLNEQMRDSGEVVYPGGRGVLVSQMLATYQFGLSFFSVISIFVGGFLIYNTFAMTVVERTREIGMLRAIGMNRWQILRSVLSEALLLSFIGSALGLVAGFFLARGLMRIMGNVVTPVDQNVLSISWQALAQSLGVGIGVTIAAALVPATQAARIVPIEALRSRGRSDETVPAWIWMGGVCLMIAGWIMIYYIRWPSWLTATIGGMAILMVLFGATLTVTLAVIWLERFTRPLAGKLYGNEGALGSANVQRSVGRTTLTVASLMVALTMIISIGSLAFSFEEDITGWIESVLGGDLYVRSPVPMRESFARLLQDVPGVAVVTPARVLRVRAAPISIPPDVTDDSFYFNALDPTTFRLVAEMEFAANQGDPQENWARLEAGSAVFISNIVADRYRLKKGETVTLVTPRGEHAFYVAGEVLDFTGQGGIIYGTYEDMHDWFGKQGVDRFTIKVTPGFSVEEVGREIEARYQKRRHVSVQTTQAFKQSILELVDQSFRLFDVLSLIGMIIGGLGVVNTLTMNVIERQREIGGLRSLGMTRRQVLHMVLAEALAMGVMGGFYGLAFGYAIGHVMIFGMNMMVGYDLTYSFTPQPFLVGVVIALGVAQFAALYPARRAASVNIVEAIKHE